MTTTKHPWDSVDDITRHIIQTVGPSYMIIDLAVAYKSIYDRVREAWGGKAFHRALVSCAIAAMTWKKVMKKKASIASIISALKSFDLESIGISKDASNITTHAITRTIKHVNIDLCSHEEKDTKLRIVDREDDGVLNDKEFLEKERKARLEYYCVDCGNLLSIKTMTFKYKMVLDTIRRLDPLSRGVMIKDAISTLRQEHLLVPKRNKDERKLVAALYVSFKILMKPFIDRGLIKIEEKTRNKRVWWLKNVM